MCISSSIVFVDVNALLLRFLLLFFFNDTATTEIYTLSLHDALPICERASHGDVVLDSDGDTVERAAIVPVRSEEHTSELQSRFDLVCRLLLEKKKKKPKRATHAHPSTRS